MKKSFNNSMDVFCFLLFNKKYSNSKRWFFDFTSGAITCDYRFYKSIKRKMKA